MGRKSLKLWREVKHVVKAVGAFKSSRGNAPSYGVFEEFQSADGESMSYAQRSPPLYTERAQSVSATSHSCRNLCLGLVAVILIVGIAAGVVGFAVVKHRKDAAFDSVLETLCKTTQYPDVCMTTVASNSSSSSSKDVVLNSVRAGMGNVYDMIDTVSELNESATDVDLNAALIDCLETLGNAVGHLNDTLAQLQSLDLKSIQDDVEDMLTWMSAALTDHTTCVDGFEALTNDSQSNATLLIQSKGQFVDKVLSNALSLVSSFASLGNDLNRWKDALGARGRNLRERERTMMEGSSKWMSAEDRRQLTDGLVSSASAIVAQDGSGQFQKIQDAVNAAPSHNGSRYIIYIKKGTYVGQVTVPKSKTNLMFLGDGVGVTILTFARNVQQPGVTTYTSGTLLVNGNGFIAKDITVQNTAGAGQHQAVAIRVSADKCAFQRCSLEGYQDTLYVQKLRQFFKDCSIYGTVDFIFGNAAAVLQTCSIMARVPMAGQQNTVTAQGRTDKSQNTGLSLLSCTLDGVPELKKAEANFSTYLGRPWKAFSQTVVMKSTLEDVINAAGWLPWNGDFALKTLYYAEYDNDGPGAGAKLRVPWSSQISSLTVASRFSVSSFISGQQWLPSTTVAFTTAL